MTNDLYRLGSLIRSCFDDILPSDSERHALMDKLHSGGDLGMRERETLYLLLHVVGSMSDSKAQRRARKRRDFAGIVLFWKELARELYGIPAGDAEHQIATILDMDVETLSRRLRPSRVYGRHKAKG